MYNYTEPKRGSGISEFERSYVQISCGADAAGKFVTGDPDHQRQTWNFSKEETKNPSRNEGCENVGLEPGTP